MTTRLAVITIAACCGLAHPCTAQSSDRIRGAWEAEIYRLRNGEEHPVAGHIFFTEREWTVLFFVLVDGEPRRGSAEGGTFTLVGDSLTFRHQYNLSVGDAVGALPEAPLRMMTRSPREATSEPSRVAVDAGRLILFFPSGNSMVFRRPP